MNDGIVVVSLIVLLIARQFCDGSKSDFAKRLARFMTPVIIPLAIILVFIIFQLIGDID